MYAYMYADVHTDTRRHHIPMEARVAARHGPLDMGLGTELSCPLQEQQASPSMEPSLQPSMPNSSH